MAQIPLGTVSGGGGGGVFSGSVADLFATLGLDATSFSDTLRKSKVELNETSKNVLVLIDFLKQLQTQAGPTVAVAAFEQLNAQLSRSTRQLFAWQQQVVPALKEANAVLAGGGMVPPTGGGGAAATGGPLSGGGGSQFLIARLTERFLIYQGLRFAVQGISAALHEADDITRRMDQTGWGSEGIQRFTLASERLHVPVDQATSSIARFEEKIDSRDTSAIKALDRLGLRFVDVQRQMGVSPQAAFETVIARMAKESNQGALADDAFAIFQDRSGKMLAFIKEYDRLKRESANVPILNDDDKTALEQLNRTIQRIEQLSSVGFAKGVRWMLNLPGLVDTPVGVPSSLGGVAYAPNPLSNLKPLPSHGGPPNTLGAASSPTGSVDSINRMLDEFRAPHELSMRKLNEDWQTVLFMERQGLATHSQVIEFSQRASMKLTEEAQAEIDAIIKHDVKLTEEAQAEIDAIIKHDVSLLTEFGAQGKRTTELMARDFQDLTESFRQNRISVEEMNEATANYFSMLEENAARPALKEAIRMFEQGLIGPDELLRARERARALTTRTGAETAFEQGLIGPAGLMDAQQRYRRSLEDFAPDRGSRYFLGPGGSILAEPRRDSLPMTRPSDMRGPQGSLNIIPLDQFSDQMLRRWKQQGY